MEDHQVRPLEFVHFGFELGDERSRGVGVDLFALVVEEIEIFALGEVVWAAGGLEVEGIEVGDLDLVAGALENVDREVLHGGAEGTRLGVSVDDEDIHTPNLEALSGALDVSFTTLGSPPIRSAPPKPT